MLRERVLTWHGEPLSLVMHFCKARITLYTMNPSSSGLAGSLSLSLHENYSMGKLVEGVWVQSRTFGRASHSLISHTKGARSTGEVEGQQRLASRLLTASPHNRYMSAAVRVYEHSCKPSLIIVHSIAMYKIIQTCLGTSQIQTAARVRKN